MIRSFIAIDVPKEIKNKIAKIQMELQPILPKVSWVNPPNIHLTLKFLGDVASNRIPSITGAISHTVQNQVPFNIKLSSISAFKNFSYPTILWIGISTDPTPIVKLAKNLNLSLNSILLNYFLSFLVFLKTKVKNFHIKNQLKASQY